MIAPPLAVSFDSPGFLLVLALAPLLWLVHREAERRQRRYPVRFTAVDTLVSVMPTGPDWRRHAPVALLVAALAFLAIALAKPERKVDVPIQRASVVLVTDVSRSMQAGDVAPTRLDAARKAGLEFVDQVPDGVKVGLVAFSTTAETLQTPTSRHDEVRSALQTLQPISGTSTGAGLRTALEDLRIREQGLRPPSAIILLSDGVATDGNAALVAARDAKRVHTPIYTVSLGTPDGVLETQDQFGQTRLLRFPPDPEALAAIAQTSGGEAFTAADSGTLKSIYNRLGRQLGSRSEHRQVTSAFAGIALLLLLGGLAASLRWGARLP